MRKETRKTKREWHRGARPAAAEESGDAAEDVDRNGEEFRSGEEARAKPLAALPSPSKMEWVKHVVSHIPFRCWCRHCVAD